MAAFFDNTELASFAGWHFPVSSVSATCSLRHHVHSYPHTPGGALEKIGRGVWHIRMTPVFDESIGKSGGIGGRYSQLNAEGLPLFPHVLNVLQDLFETETTAPLCVPALGTFPACMVNFSRTSDWSNRSGEHVEFEFIEDQSDVVLVDNIWTGKTQDQVATATKKFARELIASKTPGGLLGDLAAGAVGGATLRASLPDEPETEMVDLFDAIDGIANAGFAVFDSVELLQDRVAAKLEGFKNIISRAETKTKWMQRPENWRVVESAKELAATAESMRRTILNLTAKRTYIVPQIMSIQDVSVAIYQSAGRSLDLMMMNGNLTEQNVDWAAIPAGTEIKYTAFR